MSDLLYLREVIFLNKNILSIGIIILLTFSVVSPIVFGYKINISNSVETAQLLGDPMDSPWPMYCHDIRHTGRSPYSTASNIGYEKWRFDTIDVVGGSPIVDYDGVIYIGSSHLFAIYPNGTLKWEYNEWIETRSAPAIDENGVLYIGSIWAMHSYLYAIYTNKIKTNII